MSLLATDMAPLAPASRRRLAAALRPAGQFDGWLGLLRALDQALQTLDPDRADQRRLSTVIQRRGTP
jgi:hypothetical protein